MSTSSHSIDRRRFLLGGAAVLGTAGLAACSDDRGGADDGSATLRMAWWGGAARHDKKNAIIDLYLEQNPEVTFNREFAEWSGYWERFATQGAGRNLPDIVGMTEQQVGDYNDLLTDLQPFIDDGTLDVSDFEDIYVEGGTVDGKLSMLFLGGTMPSLITNTGALGDVGVDAASSAEWDYEDLRAAARAISDAGDGSMWGVQDSGGDVGAFHTFLMQRGTRMFVDGQLGYTVDHLTEWLELWNSLRQDGCLPPFDVQTEFLGAPFEDTMLARGMVGMVIANHNHMPILQQSIEADLLLARPPVVTGGEPATLVTGTYVSIAENSQHQEIAADFLNFYVNDPQAITLFEAEYGVLPAQKQVDLIIDDVDAPMQRALDYATAVTDIAIIDTPRPVGGLEVAATILAANESVALGEAPAAVAATYHTQAESLLSS